MNGRQQGRSTWVIPLLALSLATCDDPLGPDAGADCELPPQPPVISGLQAPIGLDALHDALAHAAGPMASAVGSPELTQSLEQIAGLSTASTAAGFTVTGCTVIVHALDELDVLPDDPATRPDREGIRLVLLLAGRALEVQEQGQ